MVKKRGDGVGRRPPRVTGAGPGTVGAPRAPVHGPAVVELEEGLGEEARGVHHPVLGRGQSPLHVGAHLLCGEAVLRLAAAHAGAQAENDALGGEERDWKEKKRRHCEGEGSTQRAGWASAHLVQGGDLALLLVVDSALLQSGGLQQGLILVQGVQGDVVETHGPLLPRHEGSGQRLCRPRVGRCVRPRVPRRARSCGGRVRCRVPPLPRARSVGGANGALPALPGRLGPLLPCLLLPLADGSAVGVVQQLWCGFGQQHQLGSVKLLELGAAARHACARTRRRRVRAPVQGLATAGRKGGEGPRTGEVDAQAADGPGQLQGPRCAPCAVDDVLGEAPLEEEAGGEAALGRCGPCLLPSLQARAPMRTGASVQVAHLLEQVQRVLVAHDGGRVQRCHAGGPPGEGG